MRRTDSCSADLERAEVNYKGKWQHILMELLRQRETVAISTRKATEIGYISELVEEGKIEIVARESGAITCRLRAFAKQKTN